MTSIAAPALESAPRVVRVACRALQVAALVSAAGIVFLVGMFVAFALEAPSTAMALGWVNDVLVIGQYALLLPAVVVLHRVFRARWPERFDAYFVVALPVSFVVAALVGVVLERGGVGHRLVSIVPPIWRGPRPCGAGGP